MLTRTDTLLLIVDIQEKLVPVIHARKEVLLRAKQLIQGARVLSIPVLCTEHNPKGLGLTVPEIASFMPGIQPIAKLSFGSFGSRDFVAALEAANRRNVLMAGMETHVCVYQTALELLEKGYHVEVVADACSSRTLENKLVGLDKMRDAGAVITSVETALFELLKVAEGPVFKQILQIIK